MLLLLLCLLMLLSWSCLVLSCRRRHPVVLLFPIIAFLFHVFFMDVLFLCFECAKKSLSYSKYLIIPFLVQSQRLFLFYKLVAQSL